MLLTSAGGLSRLAVRKGQWGAHAPWTAGLHAQGPGRLTGQGSCGWMRAPQLSRLRSRSCWALPGLSERRLCRPMSLPSWSACTAAAASPRSPASSFTRYSQLTHHLGVSNPVACNMRCASCDMMHATKFIGAQTHIDMRKAVRHIAHMWDACVGKGSGVATQWVIHQPTRSPANPMAPKGHPWYSHSGHARQLQQMVCKSRSPVGADESVLPPPWLV